MRRHATLALLVACLCLASAERSPPPSGRAAKACRLQSASDSGPVGGAARVLLLDEDEEDDEAVAPPPPKKKKRRRARPPPPPPSIFSDLGKRAAELKAAAAAGIREKQEARAAAARQAQIEEEAARAQQRERVAELRAQYEREGKMTLSADELAALEEPTEMTMAERGAMLGGILLSPAGVPGLMVGGALGGAAGYVASRLESATSHVAAAYSSRLQLDAANAAEVAETAAELRKLHAVHVQSSSEEEEAELTAALLAFLALPHNKRCADCAARLADPNEIWASVNLGITLCVRCAGIHRSLGVSVSRVKSLVYDKWDAEMARALMEVGNQRARALYLARLPRGYAEPREGGSDEKARAFIRSKYVRLRWAEPELRAERLAARAPKPQVRPAPAEEEEAPAASAGLALDTSCFPGGRAPAEAAVEAPAAKKPRQQQGGKRTSRRAVTSLSSDGRRELA